MSSDLRDPLNQYLETVAPIAVVAVDREGLVLAWNRQASETFRHEEREVLAKPLARLFPKSEQPKLRQLIADGLASEQPGTAEILERVAENGRPQFVEVRIVTPPGALRAQTEKPGPGLLVVVQDVTARVMAERERAEAAVRDREEALRLALEAGRMGTWEWNILTGEVNWSPGLEAIHGLAPGTFAGTFTAYVRDIHPEDRDLVTRSLARTLELGSDHDVEYRIVWPDGTVRWVEGRGQVYRDGDGRPVRMRGICMDVTERKRAEEALRFLAKASALLARSLDYEATLASVARLAVPHLADWCAVDVLEEDGAIRRFAVTRGDPAKGNWAGEIQRRYPPDAAARGIGSNVWRTGRLEFYPEVSDSLLVAAARDDEQAEILRRVGLKSAVVVPLVARGRTLGAISLAAAESSRRYGPAEIALAEDLARRVALAVDNARLYREAQDAIRQRDEFLAIVTHDLKNPLTMIKGRAQLLERRAARSNEPEIEPFADGLSRIAMTATKMTAQINELLDLVHLQTGQPVELVEQPTDLVALALRLADEHQKATERHQVRVDATMPKLVGVWDQARLERVIDNLIANAIKYSPNGGKITITLSREASTAGDWAVLEVRDQGLGVPAADLPHIFERFRRAGNVAGRIGGTGIGLTSARQIVELHGGTITVTSQEGAGSTFAVRLPLATEDVSPNPVPDTGSMDATWAG